MHQAVVLFCSEIRDAYPKYFTGARVLDCGSLDINGNNRYLFSECDYTGLDVGAGKNVDVVSLMHEYEPGHQFDTIISTEAFEHDLHLRESVAQIVKLLKPGGLFLFTCAGVGRHEHGTHRHSRADCPLTEWDFYENVKAEMIEDLLVDFPVKQFRTVGVDLQFWGIKANKYHGYLLPVWGVKDVE